MTLRVGLTYNLAGKTPPGEPEDFYAEYDHEETVQAIENAIRSGGHATERIEADQNAYEKLARIRPDIVFNIAEGLPGESRESQIPTILEMLGIPYTGSGPLTLAITLNKARTKELIAYHGIPTPEFRVYDKPPHAADGFPLPAIVKPIEEGSSKGIREDSVVKTGEELVERVKQRIKTYRQPVIVERFLAGREFTTAILGNGSPRVLPIVEVLFDDLPEGANGIDSYEAKWVWDDPKKPADCIRCPAEVDRKLEAEIRKVSVDAYKALGCRDWARMDIRLDEDGVPNILEVNALPGMIPDPAAHSRFPAAASAAGLTYEETILSVLDSVIKRHGKLKR